MVGTVLDGSYRIVRLLGSGGMGDVFEAEHLRLHKPIAVKMLQPELRNHQAALERFHREAKICASSGHANIVNVMDFNQLPNGTPYLVMELLHGEDLEERILKKGPLSPGEVLALGKQVCEALAWTHAQGILHRDIKPSNIFICDDPQHENIKIKVLDFGISKVRHSLEHSVTQSREILGSPAYLSPEMAENGTEAMDERSDLFSLGAVMYEALTGKSPFAAESIPQMLYKIVHTEPPQITDVRPDVPSELADAVHGLLNKHRTLRPANAQEALKRFNQIGKRSSGRPSARPRPAPSPFSSPWLWLFILCIVAASFWGVWTYTAPSPNPTPTQVAPATPDPTDPSTESEAAPPPKENAEVKDIAPEPQTIDPPPVTKQPMREKRHHGKANGKKRGPDLDPLL